MCLNCWQVWLFNKSPFARCARPGEGIPDGSLDLASNHRSGSGFWKTTLPPFRLHDRGPARFQAARWEGYLAFLLESPSKIRKRVTGLFGTFWPWINGFLEPGAGGGGSLASLQEDLDQKPKW